MSCLLIAPESKDFCESLSISILQNIVLTQHSVELYIITEAAEGEHFPDAFDFKQDEKCSDTKAKWGG